MKFWNKGRHTRLRHWTKISIETFDVFPREIFFFKKELINHIKRELQKMPGNGKFYISTNNCREVWFEDGKDAVYVTLKGITKWQ